MARSRSKSKAAATLWAIFLGTLGAHKLYMGLWGWGPFICWLCSPLLVAFVDWIRYVLMTDEEFYAKVASF